MNLKKLTITLFTIMFVAACGGGGGGGEQIPQNSPPAITNNVFIINVL